VEREPKTKEQEAREKDYEQYRKPENKPYGDKGDHRERSMGNDDRSGHSHQEHWKKQN
jgi:hypothetical protein